MKDFSFYADKVTVSPSPSGNPDSYLTLVIANPSLCSEQKFTICRVTRVEGMTDAELAKSKQALAIVPIEAIPGARVPEKIKEVAELTRPGKTRLVKGLKCFAQEKKGGRKFQGIISKIYENGLVEVGSTTYSADLISVPKGAHKELQLRNAA